MSLVENLRYSRCDLCVKATDRIEALEELTDNQAAMIVHLRERSEALEAALLEIEEEEFSWNDPAGYVKNVLAIVRRALEGNT